MSIRSDEGLAFQIFQGGNSTFIKSFDKIRFSGFTLPPTQHHSFFRKWKFVYMKKSFMCYPERNCRKRTRLNGRLNSQTRHTETISHV